MEGPVARGLRDFRGLPCDSLVGRTSSHEKHLDKFFKIFVLSVLATGPGDLLAAWFGREKCVFCVSRSIFKTFQFPSTFLWLFIVFLISSISQTHRALNSNLHCWSSLQPHSSRKRYGFLFSHSILHVYKCISSFLWDFVSLCALQWFEHGFA